MTNEVKKEKSKFDIFQEDSPEGEALRKSYGPRFEALKKEILDEIAAEKIEKAIIKENGSIPDGFEMKNGTLVKKHISDKEWVKQYEKNVAKELEESKPFVVKLSDEIKERMQKMRDVYQNIKNEIDKGHNPK